MLRAISPGNDAYNSKSLFQKKTKNLLKSNSNSSISILPNIKQMKNQTTTTEEIKILQNTMNITNYIYPEINKIQKEPSFRDFVTSQKKKYGGSLIDIPNFNFKNSVILNNNGKNNKLFFNKNYKLKSIEKSMIKSSSCLNLINSEQTLTVINIPKNNLNKNIFKGKYFNRSSSLPKLNFGNKANINNDTDNKCNYLYLKFTGNDKSDKNYKRKKFMMINSHKVIESLQSISMPDDHYGQKLIDIIENRINSGFYRKNKYNFNSNNNQNSSIINYQNINYYKDIISSVNKNEKNKDDNRHYSTFLTDIFDNNLLPDKDNKYNYTIHKIFLTNILNKVCKKMVEIRDIKNRLVTKKEIREEYCNELDKLRDDLYNNKNFNIINNNIYNINSRTNIININFSNNNPILNEISIIEEHQENNFNNLDNIDTTNNDKDKDKQYLTSNIFHSNEKNSNLDSNFTLEEDVENKKSLEDIYSKYKIISKDRNKKFLKVIKDKLKTKNKDKTLHDSCYNLYTNNMSKGTSTHTSNSQMKRMKSIIKKNLYQNNLFPSLTENFYSDEEKLNYVDKFLLKTKELRYTFNLNEENESRRNYSYDLEGNVRHSFKVGPKLNIYNFDDIYDEIDKELSKTSSSEQTKINTLKEMIKFFMTNRNNLHKIKFNDEITRKYFSIMFPFLNFQKRRKVPKKMKKKIIKKKQPINIIEEISKKMHKKIYIKGGRLLDSFTKKYKMKKHLKTDENVKSRNRAYRLDDYIIQPERSNTDNIYLEIETNSSEYTDIPSELDSEIEEMIRIKREREKKNEEEEGIYGQKREVKRRGKDFIISNPISKNKIKNLKQNSINEENKKAKNQIKNEYNSMKEENKKKESNINMNSNIGKYLKINENGVIDTKSFKGKRVIHKNNQNITKTSQETTNPNTKRQKGILDVKLEVDNSSKKENKSIFRKNSKNLNDKINNNNLNNEKKDIDKKSNRNKDTKKISELLNKKNKTQLENIIEEENKETKRIRKGDSKNRKKTKIIKNRNLSRNDMKMNSDELKNGSKEEKTSDYEAYSLNNELPNDNKESKDRGDSILPITSKYRNKIMDEQTDDAGNNRETKNNNKINESNIISDKHNINDDNNIENKINKDQETEEEELSEIIADSKQNSIMIYQESLLSSLSEDDNELTKKQNLTFSYFRPKKIEYYLKKKKKTQNTDEIKDSAIKKNKNEENEGDREGEDEDESYKEDEEIENNKERIKRWKKKINIKNIKESFSDDNNKEDIKEDEDENEEIKVEKLPKKLGWEERFKLFKNYIKKLKYMTAKQFIDDSLKFLKEDEKADNIIEPNLVQEEQDDKIKQYKEFLLQAQKRGNKYNQFYPSHIVFTPGFVFNANEFYE